MDSVSRDVEILKKIMLVDNEIAFSSNHVNSMKEIINSKIFLVEKLKEKIDIVKKKKENEEGDIAVENDKISVYESQLANAKSKIDNVLSEREFEALNEQIEVSTASIELCKKDIKRIVDLIQDYNGEIDEFNFKINCINDEIKKMENQVSLIFADSNEKIDVLAERRCALLDELGSDTRVLYESTKNDSTNGIAIVSVVDGFCGGCFLTVTKQKRLDILQHDRIVLCESCGSILVDVVNTDEDSCISG